MLQLASTPQIISEPRPISYLKSNASREYPPAPPELFHMPTLKNPTTLLEHHPPHKLAYLASTTNFH
jgi:hypothetical protein